jgi:hypothetical protein
MALTIYNNSNVLLRTAAARLGLSHSTVSRRKNEILTPALLACFQRTKVDSDLEQELADYCKELEFWGYLLRNAEFKILAEDVTKMKLGNYWAERFMER